MMDKLGIIALVVLLASACTTEYPNPRSGPLIAPDLGVLCDLRNDDDAVQLSFAVPDAPGTIREVEQPPIPEGTAGIRVSIPRADDAPETITVDILDVESCETRTSLEASLIRETDEELGYVVPLETLQSELQSGNFVARVNSIATGPIGNLINVGSVAQLVEPQCDGEIVFEADLVAGSYGNELNDNIPLDQPADLCLSVRSTDGFWVIRDLRINDQRVYPPSEDAGDLPRYVIRYPGRALNYRIKLSLAKGSARIVAHARNRPVGEPQPGIDCGGRLEGFDDPFVNTERRAIRRDGVWVTCTAVYESPFRYRVENLFGVFRGGKIVTRITTPAITNEDGQFEGWISPGAIQRAGVSDDHELIGIESDCLHDEQCGVDRIGSKRTDPADAWWLPITNVPDIAFDGLLARLITAAEMPTEFRPQSTTVARLFSGIFPYIDSGAANDKPIVFHEAFDPLLEDGTEGLVWALGGQPTDYAKPGDASKIRASNRAGEINGACFTRQNQLFAKEAVADDCVWSEQCLSSAATASERFRCEGVNVLKILLDNGYDVWLVDHARRDPTILELATRTPVLYQKIADFPSPEWFGQPPRKLGIFGLSMGAVVSRIGIRLWELEDQLGRLGGSDLQIVRPDLLRDSAVDRVGLWASYEGPHHGTKIPVGFQALIKDDTSPSRKNFFELLDSQAAEQLTVPFVKSTIDTNCIKGGSPSDCTIGPDQIAPFYTTEFESALLQFLSEAVLDALDNLPPRPFVEPGRYRISADGLPKRVPAIAVSNGRLGSVQIHPPGRLANIKRVVKLLWVDQLWPDDHIKLNDSADPRGSGLDQIFRLKELETSGTKYLVFSGGLRAEVLRRPTFVSTKSALALDTDIEWLGRKEAALRWDDALTQVDAQSSHFNVDDRQCSFLMYHVEGKLGGDQDGYPACSAGPQTCATGRRLPGMVIAPDGFTPDTLQLYCDPDDNDASELPPAVRDEPIGWPDYEFDPNELLFQDTEN